MCLSSYFEFRVATVPLMVETAYLMVLVVLILFNTLIKPHYFLWHLVSTPCVQYGLSEK